MIPSIMCCRPGRSFSSPISSADWDTIIFLQDYTIAFSVDSPPLSYLASML